MLRAGMEWARRNAPELALAALAGVVFLGCLGSVDLWGKREQRAAAEAVDTIRKGHWLVAEIQSRPRLEKPPLPRWTTATLMALSGRRDEWVLRLPGALSGLIMVGLVYGLGRRMVGRSAGLAAGLVLASLVFFVIEQRQAGNDGPLALFTTLALYAAWRRLHGDAPEGEPGAPAERPGGPGWLLLFYAALGLGFLTKGPVVVLLSALTIVPYLAICRRLRPGLAALLSGRGIALFVLLALSWPVPVAVSDPKAVQIWLLEMGQKAGTAGIRHPHAREILAVDWPWMTAPWTVVATWAALWPLLHRGKGFPKALWFAWSWAILNLAMFCLWRVAKPNYFLPCLPGVALLTGAEWVRVIRLARATGAEALRARRFLQTHWVVFFVAALVVPVVAGQKLPALLAPVAVIAAVVALGVIASAWLWRRGAEAAVLAPLVGAVAVAVAVGYGWIAPRSNARNSHRELAGTLERVLPPDARTIMFFHELDEGLWFYLPGRELKPVPGSNPQYNDGFKLVEEYRSNRLIYDLAERRKREEKILLDWLARPSHESRYVLMKTKKYDHFAHDLEGLATPVYAEHGLDRNELTLLRIEPPRTVSADPTPRR